MNLIIVRRLRALALLAAGLSFTMNIHAQAAADPEKPCGTGAAEPAPAHPLPAYTARQIAAMFVPPRTRNQLLANLKIVFDRQLLAQPAFFDEQVLRTLFNAPDVEWVKSGAPDVTSDHLVRPTRIARVRFGDGGSFAGMKVDVGVNHKCLDRRPHPTLPDTFIPAHTYDSGYIRIRPERSAGFTIGDVRQAFGPNAGELDALCQGTRSMMYAGPDGPPEGAFVHTAEFWPSASGYIELCRAGTARGLPDTHPVSDVLIRLLQRDFTLPETVNP